MPSVSITDYVAYHSLRKLRTQDRCRTRQESRRYERVNGLWWCVVGRHERLSMHKLWLDCAPINGPFVRSQKVD